MVMVVVVAMVPARALLLMLRAAVRILCTVCTAVVELLPRCTCTPLALAHAQWSGRHACGVRFHMLRGHGARAPGGRCGPNTGRTQPNYAQTGTARIRSRRAWFVSHPVPGHAQLIVCMWRELRPGCARPTAGWARACLGACVCARGLAPQLCV